MIIKLFLCPIIMINYIFYLLIINIYIINDISIKSLILNYILSFILLSTI